VSQRNPQRLQKGRSSGQKLTKEILKKGRSQLMPTKLKSGWVMKKLSDLKFRDAFEEEYEKLSIGEQITKLRLSASLTQEVLARRMGTTASAISRYENAEYDRYEIRTLKKIAEACGAKVKIVFEGKNKKRVA